MLLEPNRTQPATEYFSAVVDIMSAGFAFFCPERNEKDFEDLMATPEVVSALKGHSITVLCS